jgi:hypothetical protein
MNNAIRLLAAALLLLLLIAGACQKQSIAAPVNNRTTGMHKTPELQMKSSALHACDGIHFAHSPRLLIFNSLEKRIEGQVHLYEEQWVLFRSFADAAAARGMCLWLKNEQISARCESHDVFVLESLRHRAEWIVAQLPPTAEDLNLLAVGAS